MNIFFKTNLSKHLQAVSLVLCTLLAWGLSSCGTSKKSVHNDGRYEVVRPLPDREDSAGETQEQSSSASRRSPEIGGNVVAEARRWIGTPYRYGGKDRKGVDCSGLVMLVYKTAAEVDIPRSSSAQRVFCVPIAKDDLSEGDLLFFASRDSGGKVAHVGIYSGNGRMIHASSSKGVIESPVDDVYFNRHYISSGRIPLLADTIPQTAPAPSPTDSNEQQSLFPQEAPPKTVDTPASEPTAESPETIVRNAFKLNTGP